MNRGRVCGLAYLFLLAFPVFAHHGNATSFDQTRIVKMTGVVTEFRWRNPHTLLVFDGKDDAGNTMTFTVEMGAPATLAGQGMTKNTFKPGDAVAVEVHPSRSNPAYGQGGVGRMWVNGKELPLPEKGK
jgi:hypothetical protein